MLTPVLSIQDLAVRRGRRTVISAMSLTIAPGEIVALVGANGSGKSTLMGAVGGVFEPRQGLVRIAGLNVWGPTRERQAARRALGYLPEGTEAMGFLLGRELWALVAATRNTEPPSQVLRLALGLDELAALKLEQMSLGQRRRAYLAAALLGPPSLLVLDEPDNGLDAARLTAMIELLKQQQTTGGVLLASHDPALLSRLDLRVVEMTIPKV